MLISYFMKQCHNKFFGFSNIKINHGEIVAVVVDFATTNDGPFITGLVLSATVTISPVPASFVAVNLKMYVVPCRNPPISYISLLPINETV